MLLKDFIAVPLAALRCIASTIFASSFASGELGARWLFPMTLPMFINEIQFKRSQTTKGLDIAHKRMHHTIKINRVDAKIYKADIL